MLARTEVTSLGHEDEKEEEEEEAIMHGLSLFVTEGSAYAAEI